MGNRHAALIERLGGAAYLASVLGVGEPAVRKWPLRGIPARHWHRIIALDPTITASYLDKTKPVGVQARGPKQQRKRLNGCK